LQPKVLKESVADPLDRRLGCGRGKEYRFSLTLADILFINPSFSGAQVQLQTLFIIIKD